MKRKMAAFMTVTALGLGTVLYGPANSEAAVAGMVVTRDSKAVMMEPVPEPGIVQPDTGQNVRFSGDEAVRIIQRAFPYLSEVAEPRVYFEVDYRGHSVWRIYADVRTAPYRSGPSGYHATVRADTGEILSMNWHQPTGVEKSKGIISREEARRTAENLARQLQPEKFSQMKPSDQATPYYRPDTLNIAYSFAWDRMHDGVAVEGDTMRIAVDAFTGKVTSYHFSWKDELQLPPAQNTIDPGKLPEKAVAETGMVLTYRLFGDRYGVGAAEPRLVYQLNNRYAAMVDVRTGEFIDLQGRSAAPGQLALYPDVSHIRGIANPPAPAGEPLSPATLRDAAEKIFALMGLSGQIERSGSGSSGGPYGRQEYWCYSIHSEETGQTLGQVDIDIYTGQVVSFHKPGAYDYYRGPAQAVAPDAARQRAREEALATAWETVQKVHPEYAGNVVVGAGAPQWYRPGRHDFHFVRVVNGVVFPMNGIRVSVSDDGDVLNYRADWYRLKFPEVGAAISPEEAAQVWRENAAYRLSYFVPYTVDGRPGTGEAKLVYRLDAVGSIDALTGEVLDQFGRPVINETENGYEFSDSWAAQPLQLLADSGLLPPPAEFRPRASVARRDAARIIAAAAMRYYYYEEETGAQPSFEDVTAEDRDYRIIEAVVNLGVVEKGGAFHPDRPITRKELAAWLVNAVGYGEVSKISSQISTPFNDVHALPLRDRNYIGLAYGLGFMTGDGSGAFRPADEVTWEELAAAVMKALPQIRANTRW
jgi:hypothetical protein